LAGGWFPSPFLGPSCPNHGIPVAQPPVDNVIKVEWISDEVIHTHPHIQTVRQALLSLIGDSLMLHLLMNVAIFLPLSGNFQPPVAAHYVHASLDMLRFLSTLILGVSGGIDNFLQLTGRPISEVGDKV
jgi:hypothetical protein